MALFDWNESYSVGVPSIDKQHKVLIGMINDFYANLRNKSRQELVSKLILEMRDYMLQHFAYEERYFKLYGYEEIAGHMEEHKKFINKVEELEERVAKGEIVITFELSNFLKDWLREHILETDKKYTNFMQRNGVL